MNREKFAEKYDNVIMGIYHEGGKVDDTSVCVDKLVSSVKGHFGETYTDGAGTHVFETYPGIPTNFDWDGCYEDYKEMTRG